MIDSKARKLLASFFDIQKCGNKNRVSENIDLIKYATSFWFRGCVVTQL